MQSSFEYPKFDYKETADETSAAPAHYPVVIIGAGPVGLTAALDLAYRGRPALVLDRKDTVSVGSRAICWSKRSLEIMDRLGLGQKLLDKGVTWNLGKVFFQNEKVYEFNLQPEAGHRMPAFINLQQYHFEAVAIEAAQSNESIEIRWKNELVNLIDRGDHVELTIRTPKSDYSITADYVLAADGAKSPTRKRLGLPFEGQVFQDRFLIADIAMKADFPAERWFWFDPPFNPGQSALLHKQADNIWRIDLQLGWDAAPDKEKHPEHVIPRLRRMLGEKCQFDLEWVSVYTFQCRRLKKFRHNRLFFIGDSAHQVSPFGARGGNGGIQDVDNLIWKLDLVMGGKAPNSLLDSYDTERIPATDENILNSTRSTDFITPKNPMSRIFRDSVLSLSKSHDFCRTLVNSGRLSMPASLSMSPLTMCDEADADFDQAGQPGKVCPDAPLYVSENGHEWLLNQLGAGFTCLHFHGDQAPATKPNLPDHIDYIPVGSTTDPDGLAHARFNARLDTCYLIRPDQHICARWRHLKPSLIDTAYQRATCQSS